MLRITWSMHGGQRGQATLEPGNRFVVARRMELPPERSVAVEEIDGSTYLFVRLPYVSDPALVITAGSDEPVVFRGQRANGAIVEFTVPGREATVPDPGQKFSVPVSGSRIDLRFPETALTAVLEFDSSPAAIQARGGTVQVGVRTLEHDDAWLTGAIAVALSGDQGIVSHKDLKAAIGLWRGGEIRSDSQFERQYLRPALDSRGIELPGARLNKIVYIVEKCRRTGEFPPGMLDEIRTRLAELGHPSNPA